MIAKAGLGLIGLGALGVGGAAIAKPEWFGISSEMPAYTTLASKATELNDKWVKDYRIYFVDAESNDDWFKWAIDHRYNKNDANNKTKFVGLAVGKGSGTDKSLVKACKEAYEARNESVKTNANEATDNKFFEDNIWKYCSVGGTKLKKLSEEANTNIYSKKLGGNNKDHLLSAEDNINDWAWHIKQEEFLKGTKPSEQGVLQKFYDDNKKYETEKNGTRLKEECKKWYDQEEKGAEGADKLTSTDLKKYCSFKVDGSGA